MTISALPTPPLRSDPTNFAARADAFLAALPTFQDEANALAVAMNLNSTTDTSTSSIAIGTGAKTFAVTAGKSFQPGMYLVIADTAAPSTNSMFGQITSYSGTSLVMSIISIKGSGTKTAWVISQASAGGAFAGVNPDITSLTALTDINGGQLAGMRNRIINGDMRIDQRNNGAAVTPGAGQGYIVDRGCYVVGSSSKLTFQQVADAPAGLKYSTKITVAAQYIAAASEEFCFRQVVEGQNMTDLQFGSASAQAITYSLSIKGSVAGTYSIFATNGPRSYVGTVVVTTAWERKSVTLTADTTGTWVTDNTAGLYIGIDLGSGPNFNESAGTWQSISGRRTAGSVALVSQIAGSTLNITGVQLELGSVATPFEQRPYGMELALCQRYYYSVAAVGGSRLNLGAGAISSTTAASITLPFPVTMRAIPAAPTVVGATQFRLLGANHGTAVTVSAGEANTTSASLAISGTALTTSGGILVQSIDAPSPSPSVSFSAEL